MDISEIELLELQVIDLQRQALVIQNELSSLIETKIGLLSIQHRLHDNLTRIERMRRAGQRTLADTVTEEVESELQSNQSLIREIDRDLRSLKSERTKLRKLLSRKQSALHAELEGMFVPEAMPRKRRSPPKEPRVPGS